MDAQHKLQWEILWSQSVGTRHLQRSVSSECILLLLYFYASIHPEMRTYDNLLLWYFVQYQTQLKLLIRKGIPREYRRDIWKWKVKDWLKESYIPGMYSEIMKKHVSNTWYM